MWVIGSDRSAIVQEKSWNIQVWLTPQMFRDLSEQFLSRNAAYLGDGEGGVRVSGRHCAVGFAISLSVGSIGMVSKYVQCDCTASDSQPDDSRPSRRIDRRRWVQDGRMGALDSRRKERLGASRKR